MYFLVKPAESGRGDHACGESLWRQAWCVAQGGSAFLDLQDDATRAEQLPRVKTALSKLDGADGRVLSGFLKD